MELRQAIMDGQLKPGERIRQDEIAAEMGVSRVPVREALKVLESEGQVTYEAHRGFSVTSLSLEELEELYLMRRLLEAEAIRRAVPRLDAALLQEMEAAITEMDELSDAGDLVGFTQVNREFHLMLFERAGLPRLFRTIELLWQNSDAYRSVFFNSLGSRQRVQEEHRKILDACEAADVEGVISAMDEHRSNAIADLASILIKR